MCIRDRDNVIARNTIAYTSGNATTSAPARAVSYLSYEDCAAYLDWSGLRFITELEYEKASKGPSHTPEMVASGGTTAYDQLYTIVNDGSENATISNPGTDITNINYNSTDPGGPMRVGIFAASAINPTRLETGGSYYGVMELSGNLYERCIGVGTPLNRSYTGAHGNGELLSNGDHDVPTWPGVGTEGAHAYRGGSWVNSIASCRTADRSGACVLSSITNNRIGIRGARTAE
jgi:formylglycine-generating enzyme required for sulfatase activity